MGTMQRFTRGYGQPEAHLELQPDYLETLTNINPASHRYFRNRYCYRAMIYWSDSFFPRYLLANWHDEAGEWHFARVAAWSNKRARTEDGLGPQASTVTGDQVKAEK